MRYEEEKTLRPALVVGFSIFLVALFVVSFSSLSTSPYVELFATASVGLLFLSAAVLIARSLRTEVRPPGATQRADGPRAVRWLATQYGLSQAGTERDIRRRLGSFLARERREQEATAPTPAAIGNLIVEQLAPPLPAVTASSLTRVNRWAMRQLIQEGKSLCALGKIFGVDLQPYQKLVAKALEIAWEGRLREAVTLLQVGTERLRSSVEEQIARRMEVLSDASL